MSNYIIAIHVHVTQVKVRFLPRHSISLLGLCIFSLYSLQCPRFLRIHNITLDFIHSHCVFCISIFSSCFRVVYVITFSLFLRPLSLFSNSYIYSFFLSINSPVKLLVNYNRSDGGLKFSSPFVCILQLNTCSFQISSQNITSWYFHCNDEVQKRRNRNFYQEQRCFARVYQTKTNIKIITILVFFSPSILQKSETRHDSM